MNTHVSTDCSNIQMCTPEDLPLYTREELDDALLRVTDPIVRDAVYAIWHTGLRLSEYIVLDADMISDTIPMITIPGINHRTATRNIYLDHNVWLWFRRRAARARRHGRKQGPCYIFRRPGKTYKRSSLSAAIAQLIAKAAERGELPPGTTAGLLRYIYTCRLYDAANGDLEVVRRETGYKTIQSLVLYLRPHITALAAAADKDISGQAEAANV